MWPCGKLPPGLTGCNNGDWLPVQDKYWWETDALQWNTHSLDIYYHRQSTKIYTLVVGGFNGGRIVIFLQEKWSKTHEIRLGCRGNEKCDKKTRHRSCPHAVVFIELPCTQCANVLVTWLFIVVYCAWAELRESWAVAVCHAEMLPRGVEPFDTSERFVCFHPNCAVHSC